MAFGHIILAGIEGFSVEYADTPVKFGRSKGLGQQDGRFFKEFVQSFAQRCLCFDFDHADRKRAVGYFQDKRCPDVFCNFIERRAPGFKHQHGGRNRNFFFFEQFVQIDFVGAANNGQGVVNHRQPVLCRQLRQMKCIMVE